MTLKSWLTLLLIIGFTVLFLVYLEYVQTHGDFCLACLNLLLKENWVRKLVYKSMIKAK